jgi:adenosine/AMP kinase
VNVLNAVKAVPEVCGIFCASANSLEVIVAQTPSGRGVAGIIDGAPPSGVENDEDKAWRKNFLRSISCSIIRSFLSIIHQIN